jgi:hypothetical protein
MTGLSPLVSNPAEQGHPPQPASADPDAEVFTGRAAVLPMAIIAAACVAGAVIALAAHVPAGAARLMLVGVTLVLLAVTLAGTAAVGRAHRRVRAARVAAQHGRAEIEEVAGVLLRGEQPASLSPSFVRGRGSDQFQLLLNDIGQLRFAAGQAMLEVAGRMHGGGTDQRVEILVNLARRMQSLVHREIELLDGLEGRVEDPDLLKGLFGVDHLATRMRRQSESLAVLGGSAARRQWGRQVTMHEVLRAAVAEVEHYSRVKVVPPVEGMLHGGAVADVIHLIAELVENATKFSSPRTQALIRAQQVAAGIAVEIEDRGLGIVPGDLQSLNALLSSPGQVDVGELLRDGRIGLYVVAALAGRHGIGVQLQSNIYGGISAAVVLPWTLLETAGDARDLTRAGPGALAEPGLIVANGPSAPQLTDRAAVPAPPARAPRAGQDVRAPAIGHQQPEPVVPGERPALPRRQAQASLAPQLRGRPRDGGRDHAAAVHEPGPPPMTGLMADFLRGVNQGTGQ